VVPHRPDTIVGFGETRIHTQTATFELQASEVASPHPDDQLVVGGQTFGAPEAVKAAAEAEPWTRGPGPPRRSGSIRRGLRLARPRDRTGGQAMIPEARAR
jgi:hypothetical protein